MAGCLRLSFPTWEVLWGSGSHRVPGTPCCTGPGRAGETQTLRPEGTRNWDCALRQPGLQATRWDLHSARIPVPPRVRREGRTGGIVIIIIRDDAF